MTIGCFAGAGEGTLLLDEQAIPTADGQELGLAVVTALGCAVARCPRFWVVGHRSTGKRRCDFTRVELKNEVSHLARGSRLDARTDPATGRIPGVLRG
jgi:hypothetical protein